MMRSKKENFQETLKFYHSFIQFNPPYHVLLDASFVYSIIANGMENNILDALKSERYFKNPCRLLVSSCVDSQLKSEYPNSEQVTAVRNKLKLYACHHSKSSPLTGSACLFGIASKNQYRRAIGPPRRKRYIKSKDPRTIIASQNQSLLEALTEVIAVPLLYFDKGLINFMKPGNATLRWVDMMYLKKMEMLQIKQEILWHALEEPEDKKGKSKGDEGHNRDATKCSGRTTSDRNPGLSCSQSKIKRTREASPDICDFRDVAHTSKSKRSKSSEFDKFKTLCHETEPDLHEFSGFENRSSQPQPVSRRTWTPAAPQLTNTSSFEFESEELQI